MFKIIDVIITIIGIIFFSWILMSWVQVIFHNLTPGFEYPFWNFFKILIKIS